MDKYQESLDYLGLESSQMEGCKTDEVAELVEMYRKAFGGDRKLARQMFTDQSLSFGGKTPLEFINGGGSLRDVISSQIRMLT